MATGKRIKDLDSQNIYATGLSVPVDHTSYTDAKQILIEKIYALINTLTAYPGSLSRSTDLVRVNDAAGSEYKATLEDLFIYESWTTPSLGSPYTTYAGNNVKYRRTSLNQVELKGAFTSSAQSVNTLFTLPADYRPAEDRAFVIPGDTSNPFLTDGIYLCVIITTAGIVRPVINCSITPIYYLDLIFTLD